MDELTQLSITTMHSDGSVHRRAWALPTEEALDIAAFITAAYGPPKELLADPAAVQRMSTANATGVVVL